MSDRKSPFASYGRAHSGPAPLVSARMRARLDASLRPPRTEHRPWVWRGVAAALVAAVFLVGVWSKVGRRPGMAAGGGPPSTERRAWAESGDGRTLALGEGGEAVLSGGAELRVLPEEEARMSLALSGGEVLLRMPKASWQLACGSYVLRGNGGQVRVTDRAPRPIIRVLEGVVTLTGADLPHEGVALSAEGPALEDFDATGGGLPRGPLELPSTSDADPSIARRRALRAETRSSHTSSAPWLLAFREAMASGDSRLALQLLPPSFPSGESQLTPADCLDAGDVLNTAGRKDQAQQSYREACNRAAAAPACGVSMVRLGLLRSSMGDGRGAVDWLKLYLQRNPDGNLAREAMGRLFGLEEQQGARDEAQLHARAYVTRWPKGPRAGEARVLLGLR